MNLTLAKYSIGTGDRFTRQAKAQLRACQFALDNNISIVPVWNKSNREHSIIGSEPISTRQAADDAVKALGWKLPYYCDADHINAQTVERFFSACDFYTHDVADYIGQAASTAEIDQFVARHADLVGTIQLDGVGEVHISAEILRQTAGKFLFAVKKAGEIYRKIVKARGAGNFIPEISMDETDRAQSPTELLIILAALADEEIPAQTIAPKFSGRFNKGVDYVGDVAQFEQEFTLDIAAIAYAVQHFGLPANLKLSIHSGSDKFALYPAIHRAIKAANVGVHLKTAGTTWLEEIIGLAEAGGEALAFAKEIYAQAYLHREELCVPYATVIDIAPERLPAPSTVAAWNSEEYVNALRHVRSNPAYNTHLRQLLHVGFKVAAQMGDRYYDLLEAHESIIAKNVTENLYQRHILPTFSDK